jgi:hypothetical protein
MPFTLQYKRLIEGEENISKTLIRSRNIYRINTYKYTDGVTKTLAGTDSTLVFVIGITPDKLLCCIKISLIKPDVFFKWLKKLFAAGKNEQDVNDAELLEELLIFDTKKGEKIFNQFVKPSPLYRKNPPTYRTYSITGIKNIEKVTLKKSVILQYLTNP